MIEKLFEAHINVRNLERSMEFYSGLPGLELATFDHTRRVAFFWAGGRNHSMLGLWEQPSGEIASQHFAFEIAASQMDPAIEMLRSKGIAIHNFLNDGTSRPLVFGWMPAVSIYFPDPDGHQLEFIAPLPGPARPEAGIITREEWDSKGESAPK